MSDESIRFHIRDGHPSTLDSRPRPTTAEMEPAEALKLLASSAYGRVVFTKDSMPAIRPVNHIVENGDIIIRTRLAAKVSTAIQPIATVVCYEADQIDPVTQSGWAVTVTGYATTVTDPAEITRLETLLTPWVNLTLDTIIRIHPELVTGFQLTETAPPA